MDTTAMQYFMEIAAGRTFWDVSENYHISQSSVSKSIFRLEDELGVKLFNRQRRSVTLTPAGAMFYESLKHLEPEFKKTLRELSQYSTKKNIVCCIVPDPDFLNLNMRIQSSHFSEIYPDIALTLRKEADPYRALIDLNQEKFDFMISHKFRDTDNYCDYVVVCPDTLCAILPKEHPLARRDAIDFKELANESILVRSVTIRNIIQEICSRLNCPLPANLIIFDIPASQLRRDHLLSRVAFGQGITLYFKSDLFPFNLDRLAVRPVTGIPEFPIILAKKKNQKLTLYQEAFRKYICDILMSNPPI